MLTTLITVWQYHVTVISFLASVPRKISLDSKGKIAVSILFLHQFLWDIRESTGLNISFTLTIRSPSIIDVPFYQTFCKPWKLFIYERTAVVSYFVFLHYMIYAMKKVRFTSTGNIEGKFLPKYKS